MASGCTVTYMSVKEVFLDASVKDDNACMESPASNKERRLAVPLSHPFSALILL